MADYYTTAQQILVSCILSISVLTILSSLVAVVISAGYPRERADFLRHYAVFNIVSCRCGEEREGREHWRRGKKRGRERRERERIKEWMRGWAGKDEMFETFFF